MLPEIGSLPYGELNHSSCAHFYIEVLLLQFYLLWLCHWLAVLSCLYAVQLSVTVLIFLNVNCLLVQGV